MSHAQIAALCGVQKTTVIAWEKGSKIPAEQLAKLAELGLDVQYILTGVRWGALGPRDEALMAMSGAQRSQAVLEMALGVQDRLGVTFSREQLQILMGYAFEHCPTADSLEAFARAAFAVREGSNGN